MLSSHLQFKIGSDSVLEARCGSVKYSSGGVLLAAPSGLPMWADSPGGGRQGRVGRTRWLSSTPVLDVCALWAPRAAVRTRRSVFTAGLWHLRLKIRLASFSGYLQRVSEAPLVSLSMVVVVCTSIASLIPFDVWLLCRVLTSRLQQYVNT